MTQRKKRAFGLVLLLACAATAATILPTPLYGIPLDDPAPSSAGDAEFLAAERLVKEGRFQEAMPVWRGVLARDPSNADAYNYLAYSQRKVGLFDEALANYLRALDLDPDHIGAREYLGELYLQIGRRDKAEEQLSLLVRLCPLGCEAREDLARAIADSKGGGS
jgi:tetratricopeptide (TPR) repeat protein